VIPAELGQDDDDDDEYDEEGYDLSPDEDELDEISESEEDALDGLQDPRIEEVDTDEEDAPKLVEPKKNKNKRPAESSDMEDESANLDDMISKALKPEAATTNGEQKLSKKQAKKLKKNDGQAAAAAGTERGP
jgi:FK506-binding nuclear protein